MKKTELLKHLTKELLESLFGFCYARCHDSYEAQQLCSDVVFALVKAAAQQGEITQVYPFIWRVARNCYADFLEEKRRRAEFQYEGDPEPMLFAAAMPEEDDDSEDRLAAIHRRIAYLSRAYREVMILYYIDGLSTSEIARREQISEAAVRQRLFSARQKIKSEVVEMEKSEMKKRYDRPLALDAVHYVIWGSGNPSWGDPRTGFERQFSKHILWLCRKKPMRVAEIAEELGVPTVYVEEEMEIMARGEAHGYGLLRRMDDGRYGINFILLERETMEQAHALYTEHLPKLGERIIEYVEKNREKYLAFPYLNHRIDLNLILWQQVFTMSDMLANRVEQILREEYFADQGKCTRPFSVFGYVDNGRYYGGGWDGVDAQNICGFSRVHFDNIYIGRIKPHFHCGLNVGNDPVIQFALRALDGLPLSSLNEKEKEQAAKATAQGYIEREGDMLYTKILAHDLKDRDRLFALTEQMDDGRFTEEARAVAENLAKLIRRAVPEYLQNEWHFVNQLANLPLLDGLVEVLIERGLLIPPPDGIGAEGCFMGVQR